jgi:hypothetical protein
VAAQSSVVVVNEVQHSEAEEAAFKELAKVVVALRLATSTTIIVVDEEAEDVALVGKITISRNGIVTLQSTSVRNGQ